MFAVPAGQSQHTFGSLVAVVTAIGAADKLEDLRQAGINSAAKLAAASRSQLLAILGDVLLDKLLQPGQGVGFGTTEDTFGPSGRAPVREGIPAAYSP